MKNSPLRGQVLPRDVGQALTAPDMKLKAGLKITPIPLHGVSLPICIEKPLS